MKSDFTAQARQLSNVAHWALGALLGVIGLLALLQALNVIGGALLYLSPALLIAAGVLIPTIIFGHRHEGVMAHEHRRAALNDPQQRQHFAIAGLILIAGLAEIGRLSGILSAPFSYVYPFALGVIGALFVFHAQHGNHAAMMQALRFHRLLGATLALAGMLKAAQVWSNDARGFFAFAWSLILLVAAGLLITYREPAGAYEDAAAQYRDSGQHTGH